MFKENNPLTHSIRYILILSVMIASSSTAVVQKHPPPLSNDERSPREKSISLKPQIPATGMGYTEMTSIIHLPPPTTGSWTSRDHLPSLWDFLKGIVNGDSQVVSGVYVPGFLAFPVVQQPRGNTGYVSEKPETITQFQLAARNDVIGLLAHNYLSGREFYRLVDGLEVMLVMGDGSIQRYQITGLHRYQKLTPGSNWSHYIDLESGEEYTTYQVFNQFYKGEHHITFQTCLEKDGLETWGVLFIVAEPLT